MEDKTVTAVEMGPDRAAPPPAVFRNNGDVGLRLAILPFVALLGWLTYVAKSGLDLIMGAFLLFIIVLFAMACIRPRLVVTVSADGVLTREIWLWRLKRERRYAKAAASVPPLEESVDDEGGSSFTCTLRLPNRLLTVAKGSREQVEAVRARLLAALAA